MITLTLAHGGTAGLIFEIGFLAVPVVVFAVMAVVSSRRKRTDTDEADAGPDAPATGAER